MIAKLSRLVFGQPLTISHQGQTIDTARVKGYLVTLPKSFDEETISPAIAIYKEALAAKPSPISTPVQTAYRNHFGTLRPHTLFAYEKSYTSTDTLRPFNGIGSNRDTQYFTIAQLRKLRNMTNDVLEDTGFTTALATESPDKLACLKHLGQALNGHKKVEARPTPESAKATRTQTADLAK